jgi:DNA-3-methyladenine glycosylase
LLELALVDNFTVIDRDFYKRSTVLVAKQLLGTVLCRRLPSGSFLTAPIVEVEAYTEDDPACHAFRGLTERTRVMFGKPGHAYVYFIYGMYHCLNVVTEPENTPGAVLIRAIGTPGGEGPGKLCRLWGINKDQNGLDLCDPKSELFIARGERVRKDEIVISTRIGLKVAEDRPWRFFLKEHPHVSDFKKGRRPARSLKNRPADQDTHQA